MNFPASFEEAWKYRMSNIRSTAKSVSSYQKQLPFRRDRNVLLFDCYLSNARLFIWRQEPENPGECSFKNFTSTRKNSLCGTLQRGETCFNILCANDPLFNNNYTSMSWRRFFQFVHRDLNKRTIISEQIINSEDADQTRKKHPKPIYSIPSNKKIRLFESSKIPKSNLSLARTFCSFHRSVPILFVKSARVKFHKISPVKTTCKPVKLSATVCRRGTDLNACAWMSLNVSVRRLV